MFRFASIVLFMVLGLWIGKPTLACDPCLTVTVARGKVTETLNLADLDSLQQVSFVTSTIWTDGELEFSGPTLSDILAKYFGEAETIELVALNDYRVVMPVTAIGEDAPIVATRLDGKLMSVRDKGPLWIIFPYDSAAKYQSEDIFSYSVWQLSEVLIPN